MLKLVNIRKNENIMEAEYIPESSDLKAHVSLDIETGEGDYELIEEYGWEYGRMAISGLRRTLEELKAGKEMRTERLVMWY